MNEIYLTNISLKEFRTFQSLDIALHPGPGVLIVHGSNGLGKSSLFNALEWTLTGEIDHFSGVDGSEKVGHYLCRWGSSIATSSSTLTFSDGASVGRELGGRNAKTSTVKGVQDIAGYLRAKDWQSPINSLGRYLSLTHFLGQSALSRLSHRTPGERLEILREVSQSNSLQELGARLHGSGTTTPARAFTKRIAQLQREVDNIGGAIQREDDLWLGSQASGALDDLEALGVSREIESMLNQSGPLISNASLSFTLQAPLEISELESAVNEYGAVARQREHSILEARRLLQARARHEGASNEALAALQGIEPELASAIDAVASAESILRKRQALLTDASRSYTAAGERHAGLVALSEAIDSSERARLGRVNCEKAVSEGQMLLTAADNKVQRTTRWVQFEARLEREIEDLGASLEFSRSRVSRGRKALGHYVQLTELDTTLSDLLSKQDQIEASIEKASSDLALARSRESEARRSLEMVKDSVDALSSAIAIVAEQLSEDVHDCPVCSTHFDSARELSLRANTAALRLAPKVVAQHKLVSDAQASLAGAEQRMSDARDAEAKLVELQSQKKLLVDGRARILESVGLSVDALFSEVERWVELNTREIERTELRLSLRARWLERVLRLGRSHARASEASRERDRVAVQQEKLARNLEDYVRGEHIAIDQLASISGRLFPNGYPAQEQLAEAIGTALREMSDAKDAHDRAMSAVSEQSLLVGQLKESEAQLRSRMSKVLSDHSVALDALGSASKEWLEIGLPTDDMSDARVEAVASSLNRGNQLLREVEAMLKKLRTGREAWSRQVAWRGAIDELRILVDLAPSTGREEIRKAAVERMNGLENDVIATQKAKEIASTASDLIADAVNEFNADYLDPLKRITNKVNQAILCDPRISIDFTVQKRGIKQSGFVVGEMPKGLPSVDPALVHSEGQMAALAVSTLCAASLTYPWSRWKALVLDDPLQHNDAVHASAFADLMGSLIVERRYQVFLTTHDLGQADFLQRKFAARGIGCGLLNLLGRGNNGVEWSYRSSSDELVGAGAPSTGVSIPASVGQLPEIRR